MNELDVDSVLDFDAPNTPKKAQQVDPKDSGPSNVHQLKTRSLHRKSASATRRRDGNIHNVSQVPKESLGRAEILARDQDDGVANSPKNKFYTLQAKRPQSYTSKIYSNGSYKEKDDKGRLYF